MTPSLKLLQDYAPKTPVAGCPGIIAHQASDVFALWQAWENECKAICDVPYWAIVWPAAQILSQFIGNNPSLVEDKAVLDCGCGGGVVAITAATHNATRSVGCDMDQTAIDIARRNAVVNARAISLQCQDAVTCCDPKIFDLILVADLFYQKDFPGD